MPLIHACLPRTASCSNAVLLGELAFAPLDRVDIGSIDLPRSMVVMGIILLLNIAFIALFYKELKLTSFD